MLELRVPAAVLQEEETEDFLQAAALAHSVLMWFGPPDAAQEGCERSKVNR